MILLMVLAATHDGESGVLIVTDHASDAAHRVSSRTALHVLHSMLRRALLGIACAEWAARDALNGLASHRHCVCCVDSTTPVESSAGHRTAAE